MLGQPRSTQRYRVQRLLDEEPLTVRICELASEYGRYLEHSLQAGSEESRMEP
jgi:hypothetical protein